MFGYDVPANHVLTYVWQVLEVIDNSNDPFFDNIKFPIDDEVALGEMERGFARLSRENVRGTVTAGDGVVLRMIMPTDEEVEGDVHAYYVRKGYYAYGLQAFCDSYCKNILQTMLILWR